MSIIPKKIGIKDRGQKANELMRKDKKVEQGMVEKDIALLSTYLFTIIRHTSQLNILTEVA